MIKRKWLKGFFMLSGVVAFIWIAIISVFHFVLKIDVFIFALGLIGFWFYTSYHYQVIMLPLENKIGRLEGRMIEMVRTRKLLDEFQKKVERKKRRK